MKKRVIPILIILVFGLLAAQWMLIPEPTPEEKKLQAQRINLALRQVGHQLLLEIGNDTSRIQPVKQIAENEYVLKIDNKFNYDTLPAILNGVFKKNKIDEPYMVNIKSCDSDTILLGYDYLAFQNNEVSCQGREQEHTCSKINIIFPQKNKFNTGRFLLFVIGIIGISILTFYIFNYIERRGDKQLKPNGAINNGQINFGHSKIDVNNQLFINSDEKKNLTFREAKLLHFFALHQNQVLEREKILSSVWEDEGVIVGRSLDVFVSRLRKIIKTDDSVKIKNVHGVGYKLEVVDL